MNKIIHIIQEEINNYLQEEYSDGKLYGYHATSCKNIENIEQQGLKVGPRAMQGTGIYGFYNLKGGSGNAVVGYGQRHIGYNEFCIVKFKVLYPDWLIITDKNIAKEVLGEDAEIITQIEKYFNGWENYWEMIKNTLKPEYRTEEFEQEFKEGLKKDFETSYGGKELLFGISNLEGLVNTGLIFDGEYGMQYLIKNPNIIKPVGYYKFENGNLGEYTPFTTQMNKIKEKVKTDNKFKPLKDYLWDMNNLSDLSSLKYKFEQAQNKVRNNREYDAYQELIDLINELL